MVRDPHFTARTVSQQVFLTRQVGPDVQQKHVRGLIGLLQAPIARCASASTLSSPTRLQIIRRLLSGHYPKRDSASRRGERKHLAATSSDPVANALRSNRLPEVPEPVWGANPAARCQCACRHCDPHSALCPLQPMKPIQKLDLHRVC